MWIDKTEFCDDTLDRHLLTAVIYTGDRMMAMHLHHRRRRCEDKPEEPAFHITFLRPSLRLSMNRRHHERARLVRRPASIVLRFPQHSWCTGLARAAAARLAAARTCPLESGVSVS